MKKITFLVVVITGILSGDFVLAKANLLAQQNRSSTRNPAIQNAIQRVECRETRGGPVCHSQSSDTRRNNSSLPEENSKSVFQKPNNSSKWAGSPDEQLKGFFSFKLLKGGDMLFLLYDDIKKEYLDVGDILVVQGDPQEIFPKHLADAIETAAPPGSRDHQLYIFSRGGAEAVMKDRLQKGLNPVLGLCDGESIEVSSTGNAKIMHFGETGNIKEQSVIKNIAGWFGKIQGQNGGNIQNRSASVSNPFVGGDRSGGDVVGDSFADRFGSSGISLPGLIVSGPCGDGRGDAVGGACRQGTPLPSMGGGQPNWMAQFYRQGDSGWAMGDMVERPVPDTLTGSGSAAPPEDTRPPSDPVVANRTEAAIRRAVAEARADPNGNPATAYYAEKLEGIANGIASGDVRVYSQDLGGAAGATGKNAIYIDDDFTTSRATMLHEATHLAGATDHGARNASTVAREIFGSGGGEAMARSRQRQRPGGDDYVDCPVGGCPSVLDAFPIELPDVDWTEEFVAQLAEINGPGGSDIVDCFGEAECGYQGGGVVPGVHLTWGMVLHDPLGPYVNPGSEFLNETSGTTSEGAMSSGNACEPPFTYVSANRYTIDCMDPTQESCHSEEGNQRAMQHLMQQRAIFSPKNQKNEKDLPKIRNNSNMIRQLKKRS